MATRGWISSRYIIGIIKGDNKPDNYICTRNKRGKIEEKI